jgi:CheY-like chemotaxis protein
MLGELLRDAGYEVVLAADGLAALRELEGFRPDVILTDLEMPNINGLELTAHIRRDAALAHVPIVMITSRSQDKHRLQALEAGVTEYLTKPYTEQHLLDVVGQLATAGGIVAEAAAA